VWSVNMINVGFNMVMHNKKSVCMCFFCWIHPWHKNKRQSYFVGFGHSKIWQLLEFFSQWQHVHCAPIASLHDSSPKLYILHQVVKPNVKFHKASKQNTIFHHWWGHVFMLGWRHGKLDWKCSLQHKWKVDRKYALIYWI